MAEFTIVGGGLAGCSLAIALHQRGKDVKIVDRGDSVTSTKIAAGIVNPITGPYLTKGPRFNEFWSNPLKFYRKIIDSRIPGPRMGVEVSLGTLPYDALHEIVIPLLD